MFLVRRECTKEDQIVVATCNDDERGCVCIDVVKLNLASAGVLVTLGNKGEERVVVASVRAEETIALVTGVLKIVSYTTGVLCMCTDDIIVVRPNRDIVPLPPYA